MKKVIRVWNDEDGRYEEKRIEIKRVQVEITDEIIKEALDNVDKPRNLYCPFALAVQSLLANDWTASVGGDRITYSDGYEHEQNSPQRVRSWIRQFDAYAHSLLYLRKVRPPRPIKVNLMIPVDALKEEVNV